MSLVAPDNRVNKMPPASHDPTGVLEASEHFAASAAFLEAGIDIICDKPLTNGLAEAEQQLDAVRPGRQGVA